MDFGRHRNPRSGVSDTSRRLRHERRQQLDLGLQTLGGRGLVGSEEVSPVAWPVFIYIHHTFIHTTLYSCIYAVLLCGWITNPKKPVICSRRRSRPFAFWVEILENRLRRLVDFIELQRNPHVECTTF